MCFQSKSLCITQDDLTAGSRGLLLHSKLTAGVDVNAPIIASRESLCQGASFRCPPLVYSLLEKDAAAVQLLLQHGADPSVHVGLKGQLNVKPLHIAAALGVTDCVRALLQHGAAPNDRALHADHRSSSSDGRSRYCDIVAADVQGIRPGDTPLLVAVAGGHQGAVQELLAFVTTDVNVTDFRGRTPLFNAIRHRHPAAPRLVDLLLAHPSIRISAGASSALFAAIHTEDRGVVEKLVKTCSASVHLENEHGVTPMAYTRERVSPEKRTLIAGVLLKAGAEMSPSFRSEASSAPLSSPQDDGRKRVELGDGGDVVLRTGLMAQLTLTMRRLRSKAPFMCFA